MRLAHVAVLALACASQGCGPSATRKARGGVTVDNGTGGTGGTGGGGAMPSSGSGGRAGMPGGSGGMAGMPAAGGAGGTMMMMMMGSAGRDGGIDAPAAGGAGGASQPDAARPVDAPPDRPADMAAAVDAAPKPMLMVMKGAAPTATVNLTTDGVEDWTHFGHTMATSVNRMANMPIMRIAMTATGTLMTYGNRPTPKFSWTNGMPTATVTDTTEGIFVAGVNNGFSLVINSSITEYRVAKIYVGGFMTKAKLTASLSDNSAPAYTDTSFDSTSAVGDDVVYTIVHRGVADMVKLNVTWTQTGTTGNVTLQAVTLQAQ
jgi:hypothetical protein